MYKHMISLSVSIMMVVSYVRDIEIDCNNGEVSTTGDALFGLFDSPRPSVKNLLFLVHPHLVLSFYRLLDVDYTSFRRAWIQACLMTFMYTCHRVFVSKLGRCLFYSCQHDLLVNLA